MIFPWTPDQVLKMRARLFFAVIKEGRLKKQRDYNFFLRDLCDVVVITHSFENHDKMVGHFSRRAAPVETKGRKALEYNDDKAAQIVGQMFKSYGHLMRSPHARQ